MANHSATLTPAKTVDECLCKHLSGQKEFHLRWDAVQQLLILSHDQATVERGFSINKVAIVENLKKRSLVARWVAIDEVRRTGGPEKVQITKEMLAYGANTILEEGGAGQAGESTRDWLRPKSWSSLRQRGSTFSKTSMDWRQQMQLRLMRQKD